MSNMKFDLPKDQTSIIKVIGVGGGGGNAVNHMYNQGIKGVDFIVCNTDNQALDKSPIPTKIQLGSSLTEGRGAGSIPEVGRNAAIENIDELKALLDQNTKMVFVTAGMGGGTGTGAAPIIAAAAKEMEILTVGIVTVPFDFEGKKRRKQAEEGLRAMRESVDTLLVIKNDRLREMYGNLSIGNAFAQADDVLTTAAKGIAEVITVTGQINVDFADVRTVMSDSGVAIMGSAAAEGENRAIKAVENSLASPLLNDNNIEGAEYVLLNITYGDQEVLMDEITEITDFIQDEAGSTADVIWGHGYDETLGDKLSVTVIATGFKSTPETGTVIDRDNQPKKKYMSLDSDVPTMITKPIDSPTDETQTNEDTAQKEENNEEEPYLKSSDKEEEKESKSWLDEPQGSLEFDEKKEENSVDTEVTNQEDSKEDDEEVKRYYLDDVEDNSKPKEIESDERIDRVSPEEQQRQQNERAQKIREMSLKLKTPSGISDLENEPAYKRREVNLDNTPHSSESNVSRYTLSEDEDENGEKKPQIRPNNSFLHDRVD